MIFNRGCVSEKNIKGILINTAKIPKIKENGGVKKSAKGRIRKTITVTVLMFTLDLFIRNNFEYFTAIN
jgi:hypothetical protein